MSEKKYDDIKASLSDDENEGIFGSTSGRSDSNSKKEKSLTPVLDNFGRDLTKLASDGKVDEVVGREKEIERVSQILSRRKKNNAILVGEPGCVDYTTIITVRKIDNDNNHKIINL